MSTNNFLFAKMCFAGKGYSRAVPAARRRAPAVRLLRYGKTFAALTVSCECRTVTFRRCETSRSPLLMRKNGFCCSIITLAQRRVAAGAAIETLSISFELFENEICSAGASPILYELVEDKISPRASVSRHLRLSDWLDRALFNRFAFVISALCQLFNAFHNIFPAQRSPLAAVGVRDVVARYLLAVGAEANANAV